MLGEWVSHSSQPVLAWEVVDVATIHEQVAVFGVAEGRQVPREGHARPHIAPQRAWHTGGGRREQEEEEEDNISISS